MSYIVFHKIEKYSFRFNYSCSTSLFTRWKQYRRYRRTQKLHQPDMQTWCRSSTDMGANTSTFIPGIMHSEDMFGLYTKRVFCLDALQGRL